MLRVRFKANKEDYRPVNWPVKHPYWCSGSGGGCSIVISYADDESYIYEHWPEAKDLVSEEVDAYTFTDRFPKPDWFSEGQKEIVVNEIKPDTLVCPLCGGNLVIQKDNFHIDDGNKVYKCRKYPESHLFWIHPFSSEIINWNKKASSTSSYAKRSWRIGENCHLEEIDHTEVKKCH